MNFRNSEVSSLQLKFPLKMHGQKRSDYDGRKRTRARWELLQERLKRLLGQIIGPDTLTSPGLGWKELDAMSAVIQ